MHRCHVQDGCHVWRSSVQAQCSDVICLAYTEDVCFGPCSVICRFRIFTPRMGLLTNRGLSVQATKYLKVSPARSPVRGTPQTDAASTSTGSQSPSVQVHSHPADILAQTQSTSMPRKVLTVRYACPPFSNVTVAQALYRAARHCCKNQVRLRAASPKP